MTNKLLAFDTSSEILSIAIFDGERKIAAFESSGFVRHSSILLPSIEKLLKENKIKPDEIDVMAVGLGPGSFTGLRVGVTAAKILGYALKKKVVGVSSLDAIAFGMPDVEGVFTLAVDARRGKWYTAAYEKKNGGFSVVRKLRLNKGGEFLDEKNVIRAGDGTPFHPNAECVARLGMEQIKKKEFIDPFRLEPLYLYPRDCNVTKR